MPIFQKFIVEGRKKLQGTIRVSGSKNAALPIICAALLTDEVTEISNVPDIADIHTLLKILDELGVKTTFAHNVLVVDPGKMTLATISEEHICSMRASILLLGPLLNRFKEVTMAFPGGCVLGKRPAFAHTYVMKAFGAEILEDETCLHLRREKFKATTLIMPEQSVTATENAVILASMIPGKTEIKLAACEPHVQDLCHFLNAMGARITGIGTDHLIIEGVNSLHGTRYEVTGDYLEAGTFAIAALVTQGTLEIQGVSSEQLDSFWQKLEEAGAQFRLQEDKITILPSPELHAIQVLRTAVYPSFATDLQAPFTVLLTQAKGESKVFETLFEGRLNYLFELEKMGAKTTILNPHQALVSGPTLLKGVPITSCDIRAGAAMVVAALCAEGTTEISNINYIDRGYELFDRKLRAVGANIVRVDL